MNSTCFSADLMLEVSRLAERLRPGARIVTLTKRLPSAKLEVFEQRQLGMSWGPATAIFHRRLPDVVDADDAIAAATAAAAEWPAS